MMFTIPQYAQTNTLNDITCFLQDIDRFFTVDEWEFEVDWCICDGTNVLSQDEWKRTKLSDESFRRAYKGTFQTVDGEFILLSGGQNVVTLKAVDSSFWEITSNPEFESYMANKYGAYKFNV